MTREEASRLVDLAIGRIFRMGSRPTQPGDVAEYERCRAIVMEAAEVLGIGADGWTPDVARDLGKGAAGQW